ncbi:SGNH/GDSL hydrolase family protein [Agromyces sp. LHK192]|uniref:SGNH/GDSL hydrolase family protein n=1 Tax=Agromyces sp. LHK192 TaxID=2498704 RepID=UPI000FDCB739|nr:SGNH/GDSL hydrolase family protein [Agromyces sp. LHK192]
MSNVRGIRRLLLVAAAATGLIFAGSVAGPAQAAPLPPPPSMAAIGDSISQATDACGYRDCPTYSWSTGNVGWVNSHANRIRAKGVPGLVATNLSARSAKAVNLAAQAQAAAATGAAYVTVQIGANDACTRTVAEMTAPDAFRAQVKQALDVLTVQTPNTQILVTSIPSLMRLYDLNKSRTGARLVWGAAKLCQSMLAAPTSTKPADVQRRADVQGRVDAFNAALAAECQARPNCTWDGGAVANFAFTSSQISILDYFHPSISGQAKLAELTWSVSPYGRP